MAGEEAWGELGARLLGESYGSCWDERSEPFLTEPLLFLSREEKSQKEAPSVSPAVVNSGL